MWIKPSPEQTAPWIVADYGNTSVPFPEHPELVSTPIDGYYDLSPLSRYLDASGSLPVFYERAHSFEDSGMSAGFDDGPRVFPEFVGVTNPSKEVLESWHTTLKQEGEVVRIEPTFAYISPDPSKPYVVSRVKTLPAEAFNHVIEEATVGDSEFDLTELFRHGPLVLPLGSSRERFISSRIHSSGLFEVIFGDEASNGGYGDVWGFGTGSFLLRDGYDGQTEEEQLLSRILADAAESVAEERVWENSFDPLSGTLFSPYECFEALVLSEYARRVALSEGRDWGGVVSEAESQLAARSLRAAAAVLVSLDATGGEPHDFVKSVLSWGHHPIPFENHVKADLERIASMNRKDLASGKGEGLVRSVEALSREAVGTANLFLADGGSAPAHINLNVERPYKRHGFSMVYKPSTARGWMEEHAPSWASDPYVEGSLGPAVCYQLVELIGDGRRWRRCADPECRMWFKAKLGEKRLSRGPRPDSWYCCEKHAKNLQNSLGYAVTTTVEKKVVGVPDKRLVAWFKQDQNPKKFAPGSEGSRVRKTLVEEVTDKVMDELTDKEARWGFEFSGKESGNPLNEGKVRKQVEKRVRKRLMARMKKKAERQRNSSGKKKA